jgi:hypothetical protein
MKKNFCEKNKKKIIFMKEKKLSNFLNNGKERKEKITKKLSLRALS